MLNKVSQMDFMRILRSLEEFLYEVMTWLVFYPRTLARAALRPIGMLEYSRAELRKPEEEQFLDSLSAPLFLLLTLVISHGVELGLHLHPFQGAGHAAEKLLGSDQNLVLLRSVMFAVFPLMFALEQVKDTKLALTRKTLRGPFFGECYPASVFCLVFGLGGTIMQAWPGRTLVGGLLMGAASIWYVVLQVIWLKRFNATWARSALVAVGCFLKASLIVVLVASAAALTVIDCAGTWRVGLETRPRRRFPGLRRGNADEARPPRTTGPRPRTCGRRRADRTYR